MDFYKKFDKAKDGTIIPFFYNEKPMFSMYNPNRDVDSFIQRFANLTEKTAIFLAGIGNGLILQKLILNPNITLIFALEWDKSTLSQVERFLPKSEKIILCSEENLEEKILNNYIPQLHGNFIYESVKSWINAQNQLSKNFSEEKLQHQILKVINSISRDIATQTHFGKLWHKNIFNNIYNFSEANSKNLLATNSDFEINKTALIVGASPALDEEIKNVISNRNLFFIIATDTSFQVLNQYKIIPDAVCTLDGQNVSYHHFFSKLDSKTILISDFCSNPVITRKFIKNNCKIAFTTSGHPLSELFNLWLIKNYNKKSIYNISAGNGTVLQLALDFSFSVGFSDIKIIGAEFAYTKNKAYCKGTYFDFTNNLKSTKINSNENNFTFLMFRTKLIKNENGPTTETLNSYKEFLETYLKNRCSKDVSLKSLSHLCLGSPNIVEPQSKNKIIQNTIANIEGFSAKDFYKWYIDNLEKKEKMLKNSLLPLLAWINNYKKNSDIYNEALYITKKLTSFLIGE